MSKIGQKPIQVPSGVDLMIQKQEVIVKGVHGEYRVELPLVLSFKQKDGGYVIERKSEEKKVKAWHGLFRQLIANAVSGVVTPWEKRLEVVGTGYNVRLQGEDLVFKLGFSHPVVFKKVPGITFKVEGANKVIISGADRQLVGEIAYQVRMLKKPDAYKGKGIRYEGEQLRIKPGKKAKTAGAAA